MPTRKMPFTFHIDEKVLAKIKRIAKVENRSASNLLEYLCKQCICQYEEKHGELIVQDAGSE